MVLFGNRKKKEKEKKKEDDEIDREQKMNLKHG